MESKGVAAVERALEILAAFDNQVEPLTISEIARRANLYKSTALRLVASLIRYGYVVQLENGRYHLGATVLRLGTTYQRANRVQDWIVPVMRRLVEAGSESPSFFVRQDPDSRLCIFRLDSLHSTVDRVATGLLLPLDRGAAGKVFRAFAGAEGEEFQRVREAGYAISFGETDPECAAVAAPVLDHNGDIVGALSISGPRHRFTESAATLQTDLALKGAGELSRAFGGASGMRR